MKTASAEYYQNADFPLTSRFAVVLNEIKEGDAVLEIGVGNGELAKTIALRPQVKLFGIDIVEQALADVKYCFKDTQTVDVSSEKTKYNDDQFDVVVCLEVFEHLQNPYHALLEIQRILKPGGKFIVSVPNPQGGHIMIYPGLITKASFARFLRQNFFEIKHTVNWGCVWNKDNVGAWLDQKIKNRIIATGCLRVVQVGIRLLQGVDKLLGRRCSFLYWCFCFVCENKKDKITSPVWLKQLEQTSLTKKYPGWYHPYYHTKA